MNLNKLFPRLPIQWKLAIAFVALAGVPLGVVGVVGTRSALTEMKRTARADLQHVMDLAVARTDRALREIGQHMTFLDSMGVGQDVLRGEPDAEGAIRFTQSYLRGDPSALFRVKVINVEGFSEGIATREMLDPAPTAGAARELLYVVVGDELPPGGLAYLPVELRGVGQSGPGEVLAAVAVVRPVYQEGRFAGVLVGEAEASRLFEGLDLMPPGLEAVTGLVDADGRYLYHSEFKRDWASLLDHGRVSLEAEFSPTTASRILSGEALIEDQDGREIVVRRMRPGASSLGGLILYRTVPLASLYSRVGGFLVLITLLGGALVVVVAFLSVVAARQITRPILRLQQAAHALAQGGNPDPLIVETNDELEDLAGDFNHMATTLARHRNDLEALVAARTEALHRTRAQLALLVTTSADAIIGTDHEERVVLWNQGAEDLFGYGVDEAVGRRLRELILPAGGENAAERRYMRKAMEDTGSVVNYRTRRRTQSGETLPVALTMTALPGEDGSPVGYSIIIRDERARELLEDQMRRSERLAAISVMAAGLAHELNNPLSVLGNRIELMQREAVGAGTGQRFLRDLEVLRKHVGRIGSITGDLLRFARADSDDMAQVCVNDVIDRVVRLTHRVFVAEDLELVTSLGEGLPQAFGNENVVETILVNLMLNAKHATPKGGRVEVITRIGPDATVEIEVRDSGPGVPPDLRRRIFEPFFTTRAKDGGTGLGLAVCRALVDRMGGTIDVTDWEGGGASFVVRLAQDAYATATV